MKKKIAVVLLLTMLACLTGCRSDKPSIEDDVKEELAYGFCEQEAMQS